MKWVFPIVGILILLGGCKEENIEKKKIIRKVKLASVEQTSKYQTKEFSGIIEEAEEVNLAFRVAGPIKKLYISEGDYITKGQLIAEMDQRDYKIQLEIAQAQYDQALSEIRRVKELHKRKSIAIVDYDKAITGEKLLKVQLQYAENQLNDTKLYAPFSGFIQKVNFQEGEMVNHGTTIATLINLNYFKIDVDIPTSLYVIQEDFISFHCQQKAISDSLIPIDLYGINKKADNNQLYRMHFHLTPDSENLYAPGMNVKIIIKYSTKHSHPNYIPIESIFYESDKAFVWVYDATNKKVNKREIITNGLYNEGNIRIISGLKFKESIVRAGVTYLKENQMVEPIMDSSNTNVGGLL